jgi:hypothetical protein
MYVSHKPDDATGRIEAALVAAIALERIEEKIRAALGHKAPAETNYDKLVQTKVITQDEESALGWAKKLIANAIAVDDFDPAELTHAQPSAREAAKPKGSAAA